MTRARTIPRRRLASACCSTGLAGRARLSRCARPGPARRRAARRSSPRLSRRLAAMSARGGGALFLDTVVNDASWPAALGAAGAVLAAVDHAHGGRGPRLRRRAPARPPRARGPRDGLLPGRQRRRSPRGTPSASDAQRVLIVDWDVHHGNGTQALVEHDATHPLRLAAPVPVVSRHRHGRRAWRRQRLQRAAGARRPARALRRRPLGRDRGGDDGLDARPGAHLGRLRRDARRSARRIHAGARALRRSHPAAARAAARRRRSSACSRAATFPPGSPTACWRTRSPSPSLHPARSRSARTVEDPVAQPLHMEAEYLELTHASIRSSSRGAARATTARSGSG